MGALAQPFTQKEKKWPLFIVFRRKLIINGDQVEAPFQLIFIFEKHNPAPKRFLAKKKVERWKPSAYIHTFLREAYPE